MPIFNTLKSIARRTTPVLWAIPMATGSISTLFFAFPYAQGSQVMVVLCLAFYLLNIVLFVLFNASTIARLVMDPGHFLRFFRNPSYSFFFSCYPIGATTLIVVGVNVVYKFYGYGGKSFLYLQWVMWWINVVICAFCLWGTTHWMITRHSLSLDGMTASWILPVATFTVASSTGALTAQAIHEHSIQGALITATVSAYMLSTGLLLGSVIFTVYILRLIMHGFPQGLSVLSVFAPVGVSIQAGLAVSFIGAEFRELLPLAPSDSVFFVLHSAGDSVHIFSCVAAFVFWAWAVLWIIYGLLGVVHILRRSKIEFKLTAWGLVFPHGGFANLSIHLAKVFDSTFFRVVGAVYAILTFLLWCYLAYNTIFLLPSLFQPEVVDEGKAQDEKPKEFENNPMLAIESAPPYPTGSGSISLEKVESGQLSQVLKDEVTVVGWRLVD